MKKSNPDLKESRECTVCGHEFIVFKLSTVKVCDKCLHLKHTKNCLKCGSPISYIPGGKLSLTSWLKKDYCSPLCAKESVVHKSEIMTNIYNDLLAPHGNSNLEKPIILKEDIDAVVSENCALFVLYQLYSVLEPYYDECNNGMSFDKYLPNTQQFLTSVLEYIKILNRILRIDSGKKIKNIKEKGDWESGPTDQELKEIEKERKQKNYV